MDRNKILTDASEDTLQAQGLDVGAHGGRGDVSAAANEVGNETSDVGGSHRGSGDAVGGLFPIQRSGADELCVAEITYSGAANPRADDGLTRSEDVDD